MSQQQPSGVRKRHRGAVIETSLIVALAALVVIYGGAVVGAVFAGVYRVMAAVVSILAA